MKFRIEKWHVWRATAEAPKPDVSFVPALERRRLTGVERAALCAAWQVKGAAEDPVVFASRWGEIGVTEKLMRQFHADGEMSPAGFSASVHNAAPGVFSLLTKNHAPYTAVAARERTLASGLTEACALRAPVVFVYAEEETPEFYRAAFGAAETARAAALRLVPDGAGDVAVTFGGDGGAGTFEAFADFLAGRARTFAGAGLEMARA